MLLQEPSKRCAKDLLAVVFDDGAVANDELIEVPIKYPLYRRAHASAIFNSRAIKTRKSATGKGADKQRTLRGFNQPTGAPTPVITPGTPSDVDVYIDDGLAGQYNYLEDSWKTPTSGISSRRTPAPTSDHQMPIVDQINYAYVNVQQPRHAAGEQCSGERLSLQTVDRSSELLVSRLT